MPAPNDNEDDADLSWPFDARIRWYRLDEFNNPVPIKSRGDMKWLFQYERMERHVANTFYSYQHSGETQFIQVSTVFLGINHNYNEYGPPILFETMLFNYPPADQDMRRYCAWNDAAQGHIEECARVESYLKHEGFEPWIREEDEAPVLYIERQDAERKARMEELRQMEAERGQTEGNLPDEN